MGTGPIGGAGAARNWKMDAESGAHPAVQAEQAPPEATVSRLPAGAARTPIGAAQGVSGVKGAGSPEQTVKAFYEAFTHLRYDEVEKIYAPDLSYQDPLFKHDTSAAALHMWKTLFQADNLRLAYKIKSVDGDVVKGQWTADYDFHGRPVHEVSESTFTVKNGKIVSHKDDFSVAAWAKQAIPLGPFGKLADTDVGRAIITRLMRWGIQLAEEKLAKKEG